MQIAMTTNSTTSGLMPVYGTNCTALVEQQQYVSHFGDSMQLVPDDFDFGNEIPSKDRARSSADRIQLGDNVNLEAVARIVKMLEDAIRS